MNFADSAQHVGLPIVRGLLWNVNHNEGKFTGIDVCLRAIEAAEEVRGERKSPRSMVAEFRHRPAYQAERQSSMTGCRSLCNLRSCRLTATRGLQSSWADDGNLGMVVQRPPTVHGLMQEAQALQQGSTANQKPGAKVQVKPLGKQHSSARCFEGLLADDPPPHRQRPLAATTGSFYKSLRNF
eukprot:TRINITY_DN102154_c0_g1_i1.p1 TRINITY_DN102154_c0_g1~~TRINITY_DN102154_c0_g1_i1.p1  ORF type:complete len:183 (+),score=40.81 TRINITY_DN102154_c0_g1_i1:65-613(+)